MKNILKRVNYGVKNILKRVNYGAINVTESEGLLISVTLRQQLCSVTVCGVGSHRITLRIY